MIDLARLGGSFSFFLFILLLAALLVEGVRSLHVLGG